MMRKRMQNWAFGVALALLVVVVPVAGNAQELQIADFEGADQAKVSGGEVSAEQAKTGKASLKWTNQDKKNRVVFSNIPTDWTPYNQVSFWVYSPEERDLQLMLNAPSENTETEGPDYYSNRFKVNWKGWRRVEIPFLYLSPSRKPLGLDQVKYLAIYASGWGIKADPEAVLYIDDVRFEKAEIKAGNLSFEDDPVGSSTVSGWNANPGPNGKTTTLEIVADGKEGKALKVADNDKKTGLGVEQILPAEAGKTYTMTMWKKGDGIALYIKWLDAKRQKIDEKISTYKNQDPAAFEKCTATFGPCPPEAKYVQFWIYSFIGSQGTAVVDEVSVTKE